MAGLQSLFTETGKLSLDAGNQIIRSDYESGYTAFFFDFSPNHFSGDHFELMKQGNLRVEIHFGQALANTVNLIVYAEFQNVIEIDASVSCVLTTQTRMNSTQLTHILRKDKYTRAVFQGVYPRINYLQVFRPSPPCSLIANVDTSEKPGSHWVAFYFTKDQKGEFYDSCGLPPSNYTGTVSSFLDNNSNGWSFNSLTFQSINSKVCGHYCLYYALFRCRNNGMSTIVHRFSKNKQRNDFLVKRFIEKLFPQVSKHIIPMRTFKGQKPSIKFIKYTI